MNFFTRRQVMIDQRVQGALIGRVILYWFVSQAAVLLGYTVWCLKTSPGGEPTTAVVSRVAGLVPAMLGACLLLPLVIADILRVSNRFVGPIWNLRNAMKRVEMGDQIRPLQLRRKDYWHDLLRQFNRLLTRLQPHNLGKGVPAAESLTHRSSHRAKANGLAGWDGVLDPRVGGVTSAERRDSG